MEMLSPLDRICLARADSCWTEVTAGMCSWLSRTLAVWMAKKVRLPGLSGGSQIPSLAASDP